MCWNTGNPVAGGCVTQLWDVLLVPAVQQDLVPAAAWRFHSAATRYVPPWNSMHSKTFLKNVEYASK
jgi:hypothetical protein